VIAGGVKSLVFAVIITLIGAVNGFSVTAGAEGVGRATTRDPWCSAVSASFWRIWFLRF
jgi:ABC-type transporter Mla maintaining outer membrane lipid asymmetry permease subunit MlaE